MIKHKTPPPWNWAELGIVPKPDLEIEEGDGLGCFHGMWFALRFLIAAGLIIFCIVEVCKHW